MKQLGSVKKIDDNEPSTNYDQTGVQVDVKETLTLTVKVSFKKWWQVQMNGQEEMKFSKKSLRLKLRKPSIGKNWGKF